MRRQLQWMKSFYAEEVDCHNTLSTHSIGEWRKHHADTCSAMELTLSICLDMSLTCAFLC